MDMDMPEPEPGDDMNGMASTTTLSSMGNMSGMGNTTSGMGNMPGMSNGASGMHMGMSMDMPGMTMYFHDGYQEYILFLDLLTKSKGAFAGACIAVFFLGVFYELLKHGREILQRRFRHNKVQTYKVSGSSENIDASNIISSTHEKATETTALLLRSQEPAMYTQPTSADDRPASTPTQRHPCPPRLSYRRAMFSSAHLLQTVLHGIQILVSYCLMLLFMTYNAYLCLCVVLGITFGYFLVGWNRASVEDTNEPCH